MAIQPPDTGDQTQQLVDQVMQGLAALQQQPDVDPDLIQQCIDAVGSIGAGGGGDEAAYDGGELGSGPEGPGYQGGSFDEATNAVRDFAQRNNGNLPSTNGEDSQGSEEVVDDEQKRRLRR